MNDEKPSEDDHLMNLSDSSDHSVLHALLARFDRKRIYTTLSDTVIAVNPFDNYPIFDDSVISQYRKTKSSAHIFSSAREAIEALKNGSDTENIVFRGESGSGKSFNARKVMQYWTSSANSKITNEHVNAINTILNSFATAKTIKNDSSTRFGYAADFLFKKNVLSGVNFRTTLPLETSRIISQKPGERNFNVFYQVLAGLDAELKNSYGIRDGHKFFYINQGKPMEHLDTDRSEFAKLDCALHEVGFSEEQRQLIYKILMAILHIGNIYFRQERKCTDPSLDSVEVGNEGQIKWAAFLLEVELQSMANSFVQKTVKVDENENKVTKLNMTQALDARDSFSRMLFEELFNWILSRIGIHFKCPDYTSTITIVDCYGFEKYMNNGLDQLLINTVNEKLEGVFVRQMFHQQMENYIREGVHAPVEVPQHLDNTRVVDLLTKKPHGLLHLLDDECKFPKGSDESYLHHCNLNHLDKRVYGKARSKERFEFSILHSGGNTWYTVHDFLHLNKRTVSGSVLKMLATSQNPVVSMLFQPLSQGREKSDYTVYSAQQFLQTTNALVAKIESGNSHYVCCIRSNNERQPNKFDIPTVSRQLKAQGVIELLTFRSKGFPVRIPFLQFAQSYRCLLPSDIASCQNQKEIIVDILEGQGVKHATDYKIGRNYVFLRECLLHKLDTSRENTRRKAGHIIQKTMRMYAKRKQFVRKRSATIVLQAGIRGWKARMETARLREKTLQKLGGQTRRNKRLEAYRKGLEDPTAKADLPTTVLGYLDIDHETVNEIENSSIRCENDHKTETTTKYLPNSSPKKIGIEEMSIEEFAQLNYKGHLLECRREPIITPFLHKENELDFQLSLEIFKLVLKYMNDIKLSPTQLIELAKYITQQGIKNPCQRDEIIVQICNQSYNNEDKVATERGYQLLLMVLSSFPPTENIIPMLFSYIHTISKTYRTSIHDVLLRRLQIPDIQVARLLPASRLETTSGKVHYPAVVEITSPDEMIHNVEMHSWIKNRELVNRVLRDRGINNQSGWTIEYEKDDFIVSATSEHFFHDGLAFTEEENIEIPLFMKFSSERTLPSTKQAKEDRNLKTNSDDVNREHQKSNEGEESVGYGQKQSQKAPETLYTSERGRDCDELIESDYCYTLPKKPQSKQNGQSNGNSTMSNQENNTQSFSDGRNKQSLVPPGFQNQSPLDNRSEVYVPNYAYGGPSQTMMPQVIQYVPVVMPQMIDPAYYGNSENPHIPASAHFHQMNDGRYNRHNGGQCNEMTDRDNFSHKFSTAGTMPHENVSRHPESYDSRFPPSAFENQNNFSAMSVASRIRRMPVPHPSGDVDRFLDEVFDQVLTPEEDHESRMSAREIAASIKGGKGPANYDTPYSTAIYSDISRRHYDEPDDVYTAPDNERYEYIDINRPRMTNNSSQLRSPSLPRYNTIETSASPNLNTTNRSNGYSQIQESCSNQPHNRNTMPTEFEAPTTPLPPVPYLQSTQQPVVMMMPMQMNDHGQMMMMPQMLNPNQSQMYNYPSRPPPTECLIQNGSASKNGRGPCNADVYNSPSLTTVRSSPKQSERSFDSPRTMRAVLQQHTTTEDQLSPRMKTVSGVTSPKSERRMGLNRIPLNKYVEPIVQNTVSNSEHLNPHKFRVPERNMVKEIQAKEKEVLKKINERLKTLPPPVDNVKFFLPQKAKAPAVVEDKKETFIPDEPAWTHPVYFPEAPKQQLMEPPKNEWIFEGEVERPPELQKKTKSSRVPILPPVVSQNGQTHEAPAVKYVKQPWKLTIRKEMFHPTEKLEEIALIDQVFSQIISDCRRAIAYRIRKYEREEVVAILKHYNVPPEMLNHQSDIPTSIKLDIIDAARKWPLYFSQIYEVVEERLDESVSVLLAISEHGVRLLMHTPLDKENPLKVQDHFSFDEINDVSLENDEVVCVHTHSGMSVRLRSKMASTIKDQINKCLFGVMKQREFVKAIADYVTNQANMLSFKKDDIIELVTREDGEESPSDSWLYGKIGNSFGNLPAQYVVRHDPNNPELDNHPVLPLPQDESPLVHEEVRTPDEYLQNESSEIEDRFDYGKHSMMEFAMKYYRAPKGFDKRGRKDWTWQDVAEKVKWTEKPISNSLLKLESSELDKLACETFNCIMRYMGDDSKSRGETITDTIYRLLLICHKNEVLRDEVYCQIIRQTTNNRSSKPESSIRGWRLFSILTAYFQCSLSLKPYLFSYLADNAEDIRRAYHGTAQLCLTNLRQTFTYGGRKYLLSGMEIEEITNGKILKRQAYMLPGGHQKVINTRSVTVVEEVIQELCNELNIRGTSEQQEFSLCYVTEKDNRLKFCANNDYILDVCTELEHKKVAYHFSLRRSVWIHPLRLDNPIYIDVMFFQIVPDYMNGCYISLQEGGLSASKTEEVVKLGALLHLAANEGRENRINKKTVQSLVPSSLIDHHVLHPETWADRINRKQQTMDRNLTPTQARAAFLEILSHWPTFGISSYDVESCEINDHSLPSVQLTIGKSGVRLVTPLSHKVIEEWTFENISSSKLISDENEHAVEFLAKTSGGEYKYVVKSVEASSISRLLDQYKFVAAENKMMLN